MTKLSKEQLIQFREQLTNEYLEAEKKEGRVLPSTDLTKFGLQPVSKYNQQFGSWRKFLIKLGRDVKPRNYPRKTNYQRFFMPNEYLKFLSVIKNKEHRQQVELMLTQGLKINKAREILKYPSTQYFDKMMKLYANKAGISDYNNFSAQTLCKTFEVWAVYGLGISVKQLKDIVERKVILKVEPVNFTQEEKNEIKAFLGDLQ